MVGGRVVQEAACVRCHRSLKQAAAMACGDFGCCAASMQSCNSSVVAVTTGRSCGGPQGLS